MYGQLKSQTGILKLNREHRMNTLTPNFTLTVGRGLETMYIDDMVKIIHLSTEKGQHFSNGTDFYEN